MTSSVDLTMEQVQQHIKGLMTSMGRSFIGRQEVLESVLGAFFCGGHVLIEDVPGVGKTTLARTVANQFEVSFQRIQFTPDLMPSDVIGVSVFESTTGEFKFKKGPVFTHILMADEINRTSPKTQSSLLEAMEEGQVTIDGHHMPLKKPFMVIATQNPVEFEGTFPLPEAQMDRFLIRVSIGYPEAADEVSIYKKEAEARSILNDEKCSIDTIQAIQAYLNEVVVSDPVYQYVHQLVQRSRFHGDVFYGLSPRGGVALVKMAKWAAVVAGRDYVTPEDVRRVAPATMGHRLVLKPEAQYRGQTVTGLIQEIIATTAVPKGALY